MGTWWSHLIPTEENRGQRGRSNLVDRGSLGLVIIINPPRHSQPKPSLRPELLSTQRTKFVFKSILNARLKEVTPKKTGPSSRSLHSAGLGGMTGEIFFSYRCFFFFFHSQPSRNLELCPISRLKLL